jgi:hypothetical protein
VIFFYSLCGVGVVAVGLAIGELIPRKSRRPGSGISSKRIDARRADTMIAQDSPHGGIYLPPQRDDRPPH